MEEQGGRPAELLWYTNDSAVVHLEALEGNYAREMDVILGRKLGALLEESLPGVYNKLDLVCTEKNFRSAAQSLERLILCGEVTPEYEKLVEALWAVLLVVKHEPNSENKLGYAAYSLATDLILRSLWASEFLYVEHFLTRAHQPQAPIAPFTQPVHFPPATLRVLYG